MMKVERNKKTPSEKHDGRYICPRKLAERWDCSRSSADRAATKGKLRKFILGSGKNGNIRYLLAEVEEFERSRTV